MINLLDPISPRARNRGRWFVAFVICGVAGYAIWIHETSEGPVVARVPESFVVFDPPRDPAISVRIDERRTRMPVLATGIALWSRGRTSSRGEVRLVFDRPIVAIRELSTRPSTLSIDDRRARDGRLVIAWSSLAEDEGIALLVAHSGKGYAKVRADHALMTTLWAAGRKMNLQVAILFGLAMFVSLFTFFVPTGNNPSCLFVVLIVLMLSVWGYGLIFVPGYVQRCPKMLFLSIQTKFPQPDWVQG
ncbi:MAG TPA: hypothetical protein VEK57_26590 [Thermoanaerobaculia bacterium]|nr:hypothetical protein [Thermoanaerobaculia bacterium]